MSIPTIEIEEVSVQEVYVPNWIQQQPTVDDHDYLGFATPNYNINL